MTRSTGKPAPKAAAKTRTVAKAPAKAAVGRKPAPKAAPKTGTVAKAPAKTAAGKKPGSARKSAGSARTPATAGEKPAARRPAKKAPAKTTAAKVPARRPAKSAAAKTAAATRAPARRTSRAPKPAASEASYSGKIFRSRLEARWAILLDLLDINWDYEPSHYQVGPDLFYLPDFYLPDLKLWLEVKGPAFLDAGSMAKCLGAVAGPMPLPLRERPYTAAGALLMGGPFDKSARGRPMHTLITKAGPGQAALSYAILERTGPAPVSTWDTVDADGVARARRPAPNRTAALLQPLPAAIPMDAGVAGAYRFAGAAIFDETSRTLSARNSPDMLRTLARRRAGRPLGPFAPPTTAATARAA